MESKLYVGNLSYNASEDDLRGLFTQAGTVSSVALIKDRETGRSKGFAFVEMSTQAEAEKAISMLNGKELDGRALTVNIARPKEERSGGGGGGYGRDNNRRGGYGSGSGKGGSNRSSGNKNRY
jgi:cold-inducible RNA-binding protein